MAQIRAIRITNNGSKASQALTVSITMLDYGDSWEETAPSLAVGESWQGENITPVLSNEKLRTVKESVRAALKIKISDRYHTLWSQTVDTRILAYNEWVAHEQLSHVLAAFVQPNASGLGEILEQASTILEGNTRSSGFSGYQSNSKDYVLHMLNAIHIALSETMNIGYINPPASFEFTGQKIRLVEDTLSENRGTCIDLAVLQASLWERIGLSPQLVIIDGHAMMGCWLIPEDKRQDIPKVIDLHERSDTSEMMLGRLNDGDWVLVNSTEITEGISFEEAIENAYHLAANTESISVVDVFTCRMNKILPLP